MGRRRSPAGQWQNIVIRVTAAKMHAADYTAVQLADPALRDRVYAEIVEAFTAPDNLPYEVAAEIAQREVWRLVSTWDPRGPHVIRQV